MVTYPFGEDITFKGLNLIRSSNWGLIKDVKIGPSIRKIFLDIALFLTALKLLKKNNYDVIHSHEEAAFFSVYLAKKYNMKHVYDMHSSLPQQLSNFDTFNFKVIKNIFEYLENTVINSCQAIITICPELAELVESYKLQTPHELIENTADDTKVFSSSTKNIRKDFKLNNHKVILYTGTFEPYQGIDILLNAFKSVADTHPDTRLIMVGGNDEQVKKYKLLAGTLEINDLVKFSGTVHPSEIPAYINASDIIVSPRCTGTNTPLKIYGYLRTGKPLVATNLLTHTQVLNDEVAILVEPDEQGICDGLKVVLDNTEFGATKANAAKLLADEHYSDAIYTQKVKKIYESIKY